MKPAQKSLIAILILCMVIYSINAFSQNSPFKHEKEAQELNKMGFFDGTSTTEFEPDLGLSLNRITGIALIIKILGQKKAAEQISIDEAESLIRSYADSNLLVQSWEKKFMGYALKSKIVRGTSPTTLSSKDKLSGNQLATMILVSLGYKVDDYTKSLKMLHSIDGLTISQVGEFNKNNLIRDDLVGIGFAALNAKNAEGIRLIDVLSKNLNIDKAAYYTLNTSTNIPFSVSSIEPPNNANDVLCSTGITVRLLQPVDKSTVNSNNITLKDSLNNSITGTFSFENSNMSITFQPDSALKPKTAYSISIENLKSVANDTITSFSSNFTTTSSTGSVKSVKFYKKSWKSFNDSYRGDYELSTKTLNIAKSVAGDMDISTPEFEINFSDNIDQTSITSPKIHIQSHRTGEFLKCNVLNISSRNVTVSLPAGALASETSYDISITGVKILNGTYVLPYHATFNIGKPWEVKVLNNLSNGSQNVDGRIENGFKVLLQLERKIQKKSLLPSKVYLINKSTGQIVDSYLSYDEPDEKVTLVPKISLSPKTQYQLEVSGITDANGIQCESITDGAFTFVTANY